MNIADSLQFLVSEAVRFVSPTGLAFEWVVVFLSAAFIWLFPLALARPLVNVCRWFRVVAERKWAPILICTFLPILVRLVMLPIAPVPQPSIHDEFSHLLLADTLAHGRLTNPTPAYWQHFQSIHIILNPTYASMYPPAQGVFLAAGQVLFHQPWAGVELGVALMCAASYWMFTGWTSRPWALFGALLVILKLGLTGFWVNSYMGGSVPAVGGALIAGAFPRLRKEKAKAWTSTLFGIGAVILMNSRPFEGAVLTAAVIALLIPSLLRSLRHSPAMLVRRTALPATVVLLAGASFLAYYCWRVTGSPTRMPYQVNRATYGWPENLGFLPKQTLALRDPVLRSMYELETGRRMIYSSAPLFLDSLATRAFDNWAYLIGPALTLPLLFGFFAADRSSRTLVVLLAVVCVLNLFQLVLYPYHLGPVIPVLYGLIAIGAKTIYERLAEGEPRRAPFFPVLLILCLSSSVLLRQFGDRIGVAPSSYWERGFELHRDARADIVDWLDSRPGKHLVMVHYDRDHPVNQEWVYNGADLKSSKILWAREVDKASDRTFIQAYRDRHIWLVNADVYPQRVISYPEPGHEANENEACLPCQSTSSNHSPETQNYAR